MFQMLYFHKILWNFETAVKRNEGDFFFQLSLIFLRLIIVLWNTESAGCSFSIENVKLNNILSTCLKGCKIWCSLNSVKFDKNVSKLNYKKLSPLYC